MISGKLDEIDLKILNILQKDASIDVAKLATMVNRTVVHTYNFRLKGAPEQMFRNTIAFANIVNGTGSLVLTDDLEIYNRIEMGISSEGAEWLQIGRGYQSDMPDAHDGRKGVNSTSEVYIRNMLDAWQTYMNNGHAEPARAAS